MAVETNLFFDELKGILTQFELPETKTVSETAKLDRIKESLNNNGKIFLKEEECIASKALFEHGLNLFLQRDTYEED